MRAQQPAATDAGAPAPPARKLSASEAYFEAMKGNHAPVLANKGSTPAPAEPAAATTTPVSPASAVEVNAPAATLPPAAAPEVAVPAAAVAASAPTPAVESPAAAPANVTLTPPAPAAATAAVPTAQPTSAAERVVPPTPAATAAAVVPPGPPDTNSSVDFHKHGIFRHEKAPKLVPVTIQRGVLTVDGWTGKADLNYHIADIQYLYVWVPGSGIVIISHDMFPGAKFQPDAFDQNSLTVKAEDHQIQLTSDRRLLAAKKPEGAYVAIDHEGTAPSRFPAFGYGRLAHAPYEWPASMADDKVNPNAPPLPASVRPNVQTVQLCHTNADGTKGCRDTVVPMETGKSKS